MGRDLSLIVVAPQGENPKEIWADVVLPLHRKREHFEAIESGLDYCDSTKCGWSIKVVCPALPKGEIVTQDEYGMELIGVPIVEAIRMLCYDMSGDPMDTDAAIRYLTALSEDYWVVFYWH